MTRKTRADWNYQPPSEADMVEAAERIGDRVAANQVALSARRALIISAALDGGDGSDGGEVVRLDVAEIHAAISAECGSRVRVRLPENFFAPGARSITLGTYFSLVEQRLQELSARNAKLERDGKPDDAAEPARKHMTRASRVELGLVTLARLQAENEDLLEELRLAKRTCTLYARESRERQARLNVYESNIQALRAPTTLIDY